jgi:hypothetical protein
LRARREERFDEIGWQLYWIINTRPQFGKHPRPPRPLWHFNPYLKRPAPTAAEQHAGFDALWNMAVDEPDE